MLVNNPPLMTHKELYLLARQARGRIRRLYLHWSAGRYGQIFDDYHFSIDKDGELYRTCTALTQHKSHTWHRNTDSISICLCCALDAVCRADGSIDYGPQPPTLLQIEKNGTGDRSFSNGT